MAELEISHGAATTGVVSETLRQNSFEPYGTSTGLFNELAFMGLQIMCTYGQLDERFHNLPDSLKEPRPKSNLYLAEDITLVDAGIDLFGLAVTLREIMGQDVPETRPDKQEIIRTNHGGCALVMDGSAIILSQKTLRQENLAVSM